MKSIIVAVVWYGFMGGKKLSEADVDNTYNEP
jgi:hypothetical protein